MKCVKFFRLGWILFAWMCVAGGLDAQDAESAADSAPASSSSSDAAPSSSEQPPAVVPQPSAPEEPFVPSSTVQEGTAASVPPPTATQPAIPPAEARPANEGIRGGAFGGPFSFGDFVSSYFDLATPGDPSHPDKALLTINTNVGYDTNVFTTNTDPIASPTASLIGTGSYAIGTRRFKLTSSVVLGATYYDERPGRKTDYNAALNMDATYEVTRRLHLSGALNLAYLSQPNPTLIGGASRYSGDYIVASGILEVSYALRPRISINASYRAYGIKYTQEDINQQLGFLDQTFQLGVSYLLSPRVSVQLDYRYNPLSYYESDLGSDGNILTVGFQSTLSPRLTWNLDVGVEQRSLRSVADGADDSYLGPFFESELHYLFRPGAEVSASLRYATEPSGLNGISIRQTLRGTVAFRYTFFGRISTDLGIIYEDDHYDQPGTINDFSQQITSSFVGLRYMINPALAVTARYEYSDVKSDLEVYEYTRSVTTLGLQVIF